MASWWTATPTGQVLFYGKGAGKLPTASAVISDVIDCAKASGTIDTLFWQAGSIDECNRQLLDWQQIPARFYLRLRSAIRPAAAGIYFPAIG